MGCCMNQNGQGRSWREQAMIQSELGLVHQPYRQWLFIDKSKMLGQSFKRTYCYSWKGSKQSFQKKRSQFWQTRVTGTPDVWFTIRQICQADPILAQACLQSSGLMLERGLIMSCYDSLGVKYEIPIFCINEPASFEEELRQIVDFPQKKIKLRIRSVHFQNDMVIEILNSSKIIELKQQVLCKMGKLGKLRLCVKGREMQDEDTIASYQCQQDIIQAFYIK